MLKLNDLVRRSRGLQSARPSIYSRHPPPPEVGILVTLYANQNVHGAPRGLKSAAPRGSGHQFRHLVLKATAEAGDHILVNLTDSRLGKVEDESDFRHGEPFTVVKDEHKPLFAIQTPR